MKSTTVNNIRQFMRANKDERKTILKTIGQKDTQGYHFQG